MTLSGSELSDVRLAVGARVRHLRTTAGYSQEGFAELVGLHRTYIGSVERGERNVSLDNIARIAAALEVPIWEMLDLR